MTHGSSESDSTIKQESPREAAIPIPNSAEGIIARPWAAISIGTVKYRAELSYTFDQPKLNSKQICCLLGLQTLRSAGTRMTPFCRVCEGVMRYALLSRITG